MAKRVFYILTLSAALLLLAVGNSSMAQTKDSYQFLNITPSARVAALGGQNISLVSNDVSLANQNPALLGGEMHNQVQLNYMRYVGASNLMGLTYGLRAGNHGAVAFAVQYFGFGDMQSTDELGNINGTFSASDVSFGVIYSHDITEMLRGGIEVKMVTSSYEKYSALAMATDIGLNYYNPDNELSLSLAVKNLGGQLQKFDTESASMPIDVQLGWSQYLTNSPIRLSATAFNLTHWKSSYYKVSDNNQEDPEYYTPGFVSNMFRHLVLGAEYAPTEKFYIGLGYNYKTRSDMSTYARNFVSGFSIGAGFNTNAVGVGIALSQPHTGATTLMLNLKLNIAEFLQ